MMGLRDEQQRFDRWYEDQLKNSPGLRGTYYQALVRQIAQSAFNAGADCVDSEILSAFNAAIGKGISVLIFPGKPDGIEIFLLYKNDLSKTISGKFFTAEGFLDAILQGSLDLVEEGDADHERRVQHDALRKLFKVKQ